MDIGNNLLPKPFFNPLPWTSCEVHRQGKALRWVTWHPGGVLLVDWPVKPMRRMRVSLTRVTRLDRDPFSAKYRTIRRFPEVGSSKLQRIDLLAMIPSGGFRPLGMGL